MLSLEGTKGASCRFWMWSGIMGGAESIAQDSTRTNSRSSHSGVELCLHELRVCREAVSLVAYARTLKVRTETLKSKTLNQKPQIVNCEDPCSPTTR